MLVCYEYGLLCLPPTVGGGRYIVFAWIVHFVSLIIHPSVCMLQIRSAPCLCKAWVIFYVKLAQLLATVTWYVNCEVWPSWFKVKVTLASKVMIGCISSLLHTFAILCGILKLKDICVPHSHMISTMSCLAALVQGQGQIHM